MTKLAPSSRTRTTAKMRTEKGQKSSVPGSIIRTKAIIHSAQALALITIYSAVLDDLEHTRMATVARIREFDEIGLEGPGVGTLKDLAEALKEIEATQVKNLQKAVKAHPLGSWAKETVGVGNKQLGRLLASIGDPSTRKGPRQLWAYCGFDVRDGKAPKRQRGVQSNWNNAARSRTYLIAESCIMKRHSPYRKVYDDTRMKYESADIPLGQKHARAMRAVCKELLKDIWSHSREAK